MTELIAFVDGELVPRQRATVSIDDAAFRYGAACFETMRATNGDVFRLNAHLERLRAGLEAMHVSPPSVATLTAAVDTALEANRLREARVRLSVSPGRLPGPDLAAAVTPSIVVAVDPISDGGAPPQALCLAVSSFRVDAGRPLAAAKTAQYLVYLLARAEARDGRADDALLLNTKGEVCEASAANLFAVLDNRLVTPLLSSGPLAGVTRAVVLELAAHLGLIAEERELRLERLAASTELFVTNSVVGAQPVRSVIQDGSTLWSGDAPGPITARVADEYAQLVMAEQREGATDG